MSDEKSIVVRHGGLGAGSRAKSAGNGTELKRRWTLTITIA
jgi:hypothetical protein